MSSADTKILANMETARDVVSRRLGRRIQASDEQAKAQGKVQASDELAKAEAEEQMRKNRMEQVWRIGKIVKSLMEEFDRGPWNTHLQELEARRGSFGERRDQNCPWDIQTEGYRGGFRQELDQVSRVAEDLTKGWRVLQKARQKLQTAEDIDAQAGQFIRQMRQDVNMRVERFELAVLATANIKKVQKRDPVKEVLKLRVLKEFAAEISEDFETNIYTDFSASTRLKELPQYVNRCLADCYQRLEEEARQLQVQIDEHWGYGSVRERQERLREIQKVQRSQFCEKSSSESSGGGCNIL